MNDSCFDIHVDKALVNTTYLGNSYNVLDTFGMSLLPNTLKSDSNF